MLKHSKNIPFGGRQIDNSVFALLDSFSDAAFLIDPFGTIIDANTAFATRIGNYSQEIPGVNAFALQSSALQIPEIAAGLREKSQEVLRTGNRLTFEEKQHGKTYRHTITPSCSRDGKITHLFVVVQDFIEKSVEHEEQKKFAIYKTVHDAIPCSIAIMDAKGCFIWLNQYASDLLTGKTEDESLGLDAFENMHPDDIAYAKENFLNILKTGNEVTVEVRRPVRGTTDFTWRIVHGRKIMVDGQPCVLAIGIDITERKRTEEKLIDNQKRFSQALEATHAGVWEWDIRTGENIWSDEIWELYGQERGKANPSFDLWANSVHSEDREMAIQVATDAAKKGIELNNEFRVSYPDGSVHWLMSRGMPLYDDKGNVVHYIGTSIDITERKQTEHERQRLLESNAGLNAALEQSHIGWWELDLQNFTVHRSLEHERIFGYESLRSEWNYQMFLDHIIPDDREEVARKYQAAVTTLSEWNIECRILRTDGEIRWIWAVGGYQFDKAGKATRMSGLIMDITERKREEIEKANLQAQLQQAQKMELVGQLAGGIAHDFNNVLTAILGNTELLLGKTDTAHPFSENLENIRQSVTRSADLVRQLLAFARKQTISPKILQLDEAAYNLQPMLRHLIPENIQFDWQLDSKHARVRIDPTQFDQIITNLCINARDAISGSGMITIRTSVEYVDRSHIATGVHPCQNPGNYIRLSITDTGIGIDLKSLPHIFEPFFTTKEIGKGTGLGLSTIYGIVKQNNGCIDCRTVPGKGTTFNVYLPMFENVVPEDKAKEPDAIIEHANETILLVEDESYILKVLKELLEDKGYTVLAALDAEQAMIIANKYRNRIKLLITDIMLPNMNGIELSDNLRAGIPELNVLFMSGYAPEEIAHYKTFVIGVDFIQKPFTIQDFTRAVYNTLNPARKVQ
jgi:PAS domain S-box-containing protein